jgi:hypothetical protein
MGETDWSLWSSCAAEEKLALVHLCEESFVNPKQMPIVKRLILKGLVVKNPMLRPKSESFASFVCAIRNPASVRLGATGVPALARLAGTVNAMASVATPSARERLRVRLIPR